MGKGSGCRNYVVYCHTNCVNGKRYVGWAKCINDQTPLEAMMRRWQRHASNGRNDLFPKAIRKHGEQNFTHELLEVLSSRSSATQAEKLWIRQLCCYAFENDSHGYNMTPGGEGGQRPGIKRSDAAKKNISDARKGKPAPNKGKKATSDAKQNMSKAQKGRIVSYETRERLHNAHVNKPKSLQHNKHVSESLVGHTVSEETRAKIRVTLKGRKMSDEARANMRAAHKKRKLSKDQ